MPGDISAFQFKPGQSGNPSGRPKKQAITDHLAHQLSQPIPESMRSQIPEDMRHIFGDSPTFGQFAAFRLLAVAIGKGDVFAFKEILERVEGKVVNRMDVSGRVSLESLVLAARGQKHDNE